MARLRRSSPPTNMPSFWLRQFFMWTIVVVLIIGLLCGWIPDL